MSRPPTPCRSDRQRAFTLIELIVVIAILGLLAAVAMPRLGDLRQNANVATFRGLFADARVKVRQVKLAASLLGAGGSRTVGGCAATLDASGNGYVCLEDLRVPVVAFNLSCYSGLGTATEFKGPYQTGQNSTVYYHTSGDVAGGTNWWVHNASGCAFTCTTGTGLGDVTQLVGTTAACGG